MYRDRRWAGLVVALGLLLTAAGASAQWQLDNQHSSLNFISIKNASVAESHRFDRLVGRIDSDGKVQVAIDLDSVATGIDIRNQRMREMLFETGSFSTASISAEVDPDILQTLQPGAVLTTDIDVTVALHGQESAVTVPVVVISEPEGGLRVISARPVLLDAAAFDLVAGVAALREVAGLDSISTSVPVTFHLLFKAAAPTS